MSKAIVEFDRLRTTRDLARTIGCQSQLIIEVTSSNDRSSFYSEYQIPKKNLKTRDDVRLVYEPNGTLKLALKALTRRFTDFLVEKKLLLGSQLLVQCIPRYTMKKSVWALDFDMN